MNTTHNNDVFSKQIRQRLEHYELPVDDRVWQEIQPTLHRKSFFTSPWKIISIAAAVGGAVALLYNAFDEDSDRKVEKIIVAEKTKNENNNYVIENEVFEEKNLNNEKTITTKKENSLTKKSEINNPVVKNENHIFSEKITENEILSHIENTEIEVQPIPIIVEEEIEPSIEIAKEQLANEELFLFAKDANDTLPPQLPKPKNKKKGQENKWQEFVQKTEFFMQKMRSSSHRRQRIEL